MVGGEYKGRAKKGTDRPAAYVFERVYSRPNSATQRFVLPRRHEAHDYRKPGISDGLPRTEYRRWTAIKQYYYYYNYCTRRFSTTAAEDHVRLVFGHVDDGE